MKIFHRVPWKAVESSGCILWEVGIHLIRRKINKNVDLKRSNQKFIRAIQREMNLLGSCFQSSIRLKIFTDLGSSPRGSRTIYSYSQFGLSYCLISSLIWPLEIAKFIRYLHLLQLSLSINFRRKFFVRITWDALENQINWSADYL